MQIYLLDNNKIVTDILDTEDGNNPIFNDTFISYLENSANTYEFSIVLDDKLSVTAIEGNYIVLTFEDKLRMLQIITTEDEENISTVTRTLYCEFTGIELRNSHIRPCLVEGNIRTFLNTILTDTSYSVGYVSPTLDNNIQTVEFDKVTPVYTAIQNAIALYRNIELDFYVEVVDSINGEYKFLIDVYANGERGNKTYKRFEYDYNTYGTKRKGDISDLCSGLIPTGKNGIDIKDIEWIKANGDPLDKPLGQDYIADPEAHAKLNRNGKYILNSYTSDAETSIDLIWDAYFKLQEVKERKFTYDIPVLLTNDELNTVKTGDTVYIINPKFNPPIQLEGRIHKLEISFTDNSKNKVTIANFKEVKSKIRNSKNDIIKDTINAITGLGVGKLTESEILIIRDFLAQLDLEKEEIDSIMKELIDLVKPDIPELPNGVLEDDSEYDFIKLKTTDGGLWIGDKRVYDIRKNRLGLLAEANVTGDDLTSSESYYEAVKYYAKFDLGINKDSTALASIMSDNNSYKIGTIVRYWAKKFGLDPSLIYAMIMAESSGNPYSDAAAYGLMQCEKSVYFNRSKTIKFLDGTKKTFTPSYSTMKPGNGGTTTLNGVKVDKNISNQIMFGCNELRENLEKWRFNIFATLIGYNMGVGAMGWILIKYVCDTYGYNFNGGRVVANQPTPIKNKCYEVLETYQAPFAPWRKKWQDNGGAGTLRNIELYLKWYKPYNNSLPYAITSSGKKVGYGVSYTPPTIETPKLSGNSVREKIVDKAMEIVNLHKEKKATYDQSYRTWDDTKRRRHPGTFYGCKNPICYDCSSFVTCCYTHAGLESIKGQANYCWDGSLIKHGIAKPGYKIWKVNEEGIAEALPGDIIMVCNNKISSANAKDPEYVTKYRLTYHTIIYMGDRKIAHASKWAYPYEAIRYEEIDWYLKQGTCFFLRPYDLAKADLVEDPTPPTPDGTTSSPIVDTEILCESTFKGLPEAKPQDYIYEDYLKQYVTINNIEDTITFPSVVPYVFIHFGVSTLDDEELENMKSLIRILQIKYPKVPIFIAKELKVTSSYADADIVNQKIDSFNEKVALFTNSTVGVLQLDISNGIASNGIINSSLTIDGYSFKDKASVKVYYEAVKAALMKKPIGGTLKPEQPEEVTTKVDIVLKNSKVYNYGVVKDITFKLPSAVKPDYWSKLTFTTNKNSEPSRVKQSSILYLEGTDCTGGILLSQADTEYKINIIPSTENSEVPYIFNGNVAYQGGSGLAPENTIPAVRNAIEVGFKNIEVDVRLTSDNQVVVIHDSTVDRTTNGTGNVNSLSLAQITNLTIDTGNNIDKYPNTKVPSLAGIIDICEQHQVKLIINLIEDTVTAGDAVIGVINGKGVGTKSRYYISSKNKEVLKAIKDKEPTLGLALNVDSLTTSVINDVVTTLGTNNVIINTLGTDKNLTSSKIKSAKGKGLKVGALGVESQGTYNSLVSQDIDFIQSSYISSYKIKSYEKYYGTVSGKRGGGVYAQFKHFIGEEDIVKIAMSYYNNKSNFVYNTKTPFTFKDPAANKSSWTTDGKYHIDCSTFSGLIFRGISYEESPYTIDTHKIVKNQKYAWAIEFPRTAADQAKYCVEKGWVLAGVDYENFSNLEPGDLIFYDRDKSDNGRYMNCSHVAIVINDNESGVSQCIESTNTDGGIIIKEVGKNTPSKILFIARPRKE